MYDMKKPCNSQYVYAIWFLTMREKSKKVTLSN